MKTGFLLFMCLIISCLSVRGLAKPARDIIDDKVVISGEQKKRVSVEKLPIKHEFNIDEVLTFDMEPVKDIYYYPAALPSDDVYVSVPGYQSIDQLAGIEVRDILTAPMVKKFTPEGLKQAKTWMLTILDAQGTAIRTYTNLTHKSDKRIFWDGRDEDDAILKVGYPYSTIFEWSPRKTVSDDSGTIMWQDNGLYKQTEIGESFSVEAVFYQDRETPAIKLTNDLLFTDDDTAQADEILVDENIFNQAAVLVKDNYSGSIDITVHAQYAPDAEKLADELKELLADKLIIERDRISVRGRKAADNVFYTDIVMKK